MSVFANENVPFAAALALMAVVALVQAVGLGGFDVDMDADLDTDAQIDAGGGVADGLATLLGIGRVPFMIWLASVLLLFALAGLAIQAIAADLVGGPLDRWLASAAAAALALPATGVLVRLLVRILPRDETTAVGVDSLVGRRATIVIGTARSGSPARAQVKDRFGHPHHVMVEPHDDSAVLAEAETVLLVRREGNVFYAAQLQDPRLTVTSF